MKVNISLKSITLSKSLKFKVMLQKDKYVYSKKEEKEADILDMELSLNNNKLPIEAKLIDKIVFFNLIDFLSQ